MSRVWSTRLLNTTEVLTDSVGIVCMHMVDRVYSTTVGCMHGV